MIDTSDIIQEPVSENEYFREDCEWRNIDVSRFWVDTTTPLQPPKYLLEFQGVPFSIIEGLMCISGQAGNGKTATLALFAATLLHPNGKIGNLTYKQHEAIKNPCVLYVDTEQEEYYTQLFVYRLFALIDWPRTDEHPLLKVANLRTEPDPDKRWAIILKMIDSIRPTVVIVDGLLDTVADQNDIKVCTPRVNRCLAIATKYKLAFWAVIHQNPNTDPTKAKMTGNLGSTAQRKAGDEFICTKDKKDYQDVTFKITHHKARGQDVPEILFRFRYDEAKGIAIPILLDAEESQKQTTPDRKQELNERFKACQIPANGMNETELRQALGKGYQSKNKGSKFYSDTKEAIKLDILSRNDITKKYYYHGIPKEPQPKQTELSLNDPEAGTLPEDEEEMPDDNLPLGKPRAKAPF